MSTPVVAAFAGYAALLVLLAWRSRRSGVLDYLLAGRSVTLPSFVATLVATWYGGVLGVGEYSYTYGISNWLVFGVPYYVAALLFAFGLAERARRSASLSIPDQLRSAYGNGAGRMGALMVLIMTIPAAYVLMLGELARVYLDLPLATAVIACTLFISVYVAVGGFRSVVSTNALQFVLMFAAFCLVLPFALDRIGGLSALWSALPTSHTSWDGGAGIQFVLVWYFIALQTLVEPTFYQRCYAARTPAVARRGILVSIGFWIVFDFLTTFTGLAARVLLPDLADPVQAYPALGRAVLPPLADALFAVGLVATVMSTAHSYLFLAASTVGHDIAPELRKGADQRRWTAAALLPVGAIAVVLALALRSVVTIWHDVGSIVTSALLLPLLLAHGPRELRFTGPWAAVSIALSATTCLGWMLTRAGDGAYWLGLEPIFPALAVSMLLWIVDRIAQWTRKHSS